jgi:hypothetical protein
MQSVNHVHSLEKVGMYLPLSWNFLISLGAISATPLYAPTETYSCQSTCPPGYFPLSTPDMLLVAGSDYFFGATFVAIGISLFLIQEIGNRKTNETRTSCITRKRSLFKIE